MTYLIRISGKEYNEDGYTFQDGKEGDIKEEIAAILEEMEKGNINSFSIEIAK